MDVCRIAVFALLVSLPWPVRVFAQQSPPPMPPMAHMQEAAPMAAAPLDISMARDASGTSWLPDDSVVHELMWHRGPWMLMLHGNVFAEYITAGSDRGDDQVGSINWVMGMAQRGAAGGQLTFRSMLSAEPLTVGRCGYPSLLQSGESCNGEALHDRQHPHDLFMELAADYRRAINGAVAVELYGGPSGEPALGPTAFPHRLSAMPNPIAPVSHHWLDSTHVAFGVVTGGVYGRTWKAEASLFNGREPDDRRYDFDLAALDSYSGRIWFLPSSAWAIQASAGHLKEAEASVGGERQDVDRVTASATYHRVAGRRVSATTIAWGWNREGTPHAGADHGMATSAFTVETALDLTDRDTFFARGEAVGKTASELVLPVSDPEQTFTVGKLQAGYTRWLGQKAGIAVGAGASAGLSIMPESLRPYYGTRTGGELSVFVSLRPR